MESSREGSIHRMLSFEERENNPNETLVKRDQHQDSFDVVNSIIKEGSHRRGDRRHSADVIPDMSGKQSVLPRNALPVPSTSYSPNPSPSHLKPSSPIDFPEPTLPVPDIAQTAAAASLASSENTQNIRPYRSTKSSDVNIEVES